MSERKMKFRSGVAALAVPCLLVLFTGVGHTDDTDIYVAPKAAGAEPVVMFSLDYRSNLGSTACNAGVCQFLIDEGWLPVQPDYTRFDMMRAVFKKVVDPLTGVYIGLMMNHDNKVNCAGQEISGCSTGGYIAVGAKRFELGDGNGAKADFNAYLDAMSVPSGSYAHPYQGAELFFELYRYLTGQAIYNGHVGYLDFDSDKTKNMDVDTPSLMWDEDVENASHNEYLSPIASAQECTKLFTVNLSFSVSQQESDSDAAIESAG